MEFDDGDGGVVGDREHACAGVGGADAEVAHAAGAAAEFAVGSLLALSAYRSPAFVACSTYPSTEITGPGVMLPLRWRSIG